MSIHEIFSKFCAATGMLENEGKSCIYHNEKYRELYEEICKLFNFRIEKLDSGFKYLGFHMKPNNYRVDDWSWLVEYFNKRIHGWSLKWLSIGGRLILAQDVLQRFTIYWAHLYYVLKKIIKNSNPW